MKVLFLTKYNLDEFGIAEPLMALSDKLSDFGVEVLVAGSHATAKQGKLRNSAPCVYVPLPKPGIFRGWAAVKNLTNLCRDRSIDLIHSHGLYRPGYAAMLIKRKAGVPYVVTSWGDIVPSSSRQRRRSVRRRCSTILAQADAVTHPTPVIAEFADKLCDVSHKSTIIPNGIDLPWWSAQDYQIEGNYILAIGRLNRQKGFAVLIDAMRHLTGRKVRINLVIAGSGEHEGEFRDSAHRAGLTVRDGIDGLGEVESGAVFFAGFVDERTKVGLFRGAKMVTFSSQYGEGFPGVLLEAMACGKPIVGADIPAVRAIITDGHNGLLVPPADTDAWAQTIAKFLDDEPLRKAIGQNNLTEAQQYNWPIIAGKYAEIYHRVLRNRRVK